MTHPPFLILCILLGALGLGCDGAKTPDDSGPEDTAALDSDGDGWEDNADCAPLDSRIHPDANEVCDEEDNNCDGLVDEEAVDAIELYLDTDGDGFGHEGLTQWGCETTEGWSPVSGDCDDTDAAIHPGADELCATVGIDDDCDGESDEPESADATDFYADQDGDGFGNELNITTACQPPPNATLTGGDCNDNNAQVHPNAEELCATVGIDDDCDGQADQADPEGSVDGTTWYSDTDSDGYGDSLAPVIGCEAISGTTAQDGDCDDTDPNIHPSADELCSTPGVDDNCDGQADEDSAIDAPDWYMDTDTDGFGDSGASLTQCSQPANHVADNTDCNDQAASIYPGADELCSTIGIDDNCDGLIDDGSAIDSLFWEHDTDGDGYANSNDVVTACTQPSGYLESGGITDCNDSNDSIHPGADELCATPGIDDNCDGQADEDTAQDAISWYADTDSDGYGDDAVFIHACSQPSGHVSSSTDCNDQASSIHPNANELCSTVGIDDNCDGLIDDSSAADATTWVRDADGDGYANPNISTSACNQPSGYLTQGGPIDCDDSGTGSAINPGADERCATPGIDDNCDGHADENTATDADTWYADTDSDTYGDPNLTQNACLVPSGYVANAEDCDDAESNNHPGANEHLDGQDNNCDGQVDEGTSAFDDDGDCFCETAPCMGSTNAPCANLDEGDCNDTDSSIHPAASELCATPGVDDDCDGQFEEDSAADAPTWFLDTDIDGYGDPNLSQPACSIPAGHVANSDDCDDSTELHAPGALDIPNDGVDQNCDQADTACADRPAIEFDISNLYLHPADGPHMYTFFGYSIYAYGNLGNHINGSTTSSATSETLDDVQGTAGLSLEIDGFSLGDFYRYDMATGTVATGNGNDGDVRSYIGGSVSLRENGVSVVATLSTTLHMGIWYPAGIGPGDSDGDTFGYGISDLDEANSDAAWYAALNTYGTDQVEYSFASFSPIDQAFDYGVYDATLRVQSYHANCDPAGSDSDADGLIDTWDAAP